MERVSRVRASTRRAWKRGLIASALLAGLAGPASAQQEFRVIDLGTLGGLTADAYDVASDGTVVGRSQTPDSGFFSHAFVWTAESGVQPLDTLGGAFSAAYAINAAGRIVGEAFSGAAVETFAVLWVPGEPIATLPSLGGPFGYAVDINDAGAAVGRSQTPFDTNFATLWFPGEPPFSLGDFGGGESEAWGINNAGQVVGMALLPSGVGRAFVWDQALGLQPLQSFPGACSIALAINDGGQIAGWASLGDSDVGEFPTYGVLWDAATRTIVEQFIPFGGPDFESFALDVSAHGAVVGMSDNEVNEKQAFIWDAERGMRNLNDLVGDYPHRLREARAIGDAGHIVARVVIAGSERAVLLEPLPTCFADCNEDGSVNIFDFLCFQGKVTNGDISADCNGDGMLNIFDFLCFQGKVTEGC
jgi:probable HAF family extracellular repeat protein